MVVVMSVVVTMMMVMMSRVMYSAADEPSKNRASHSASVSVMMMWIADWSAIIVELSLLIDNDNLRLLLNHDRLSIDNLRLLHYGLLDDHRLLYHRLLHHDRLANSTHLVLLDHRLSHDWLRHICIVVVDLLLLGCDRLLSSLWLSCCTLR